MRSVISDKKYDNRECSVFQESQINIVLCLKTNLRPYQKKRVTGNYKTQQLRMETKFPHALEAFADFKKRGDIFVLLVKVTVPVSITLLFSFFLRGEFCMKVRDVLDPKSLPLQVQYM